MGGEQPWYCRGYAISSNAILPIAISSNAIYHWTKWRWTNLQLDEMALDEMALNEMALDEMALNEMALDKMALDEMALVEMVLDEIALDEMAIGRNDIGRNGNTPYCRIIHSEHKCNFLTVITPISFGDLHPGFYGGGQLMKDVKFVCRPIIAVVILYAFVIVCVFC